MRKINFGIIGCGYISQKSVIPAIFSYEESKLIAVTDIDPEKMKKTSIHYEVEQEENYRALLKRNDIDAVYIATPIGSHAEICIEAANNGKHILCEKSLAANFNEVDQIIKAVKRNNVAILEGFMYQYHTQHQLVSKLINENSIGDPVHFSAKFGFPPLGKQNFRYNKEMGGGALLDAGAYTVHAARKIFDKEPIKVEATLNTKDKKVDIHGNVLLDFGKETASLTFGFDNFYQNTYSVWGTEGMITLTRAFSIPASFNPLLILEKQNYKEELKLPACDHFMNEIRAFCNGINNKEIIENWENDILQQAKALERIRRSSEKK
jgi:dTDP-3,4-didehydro-2,6-dideoxy-alpha-D-glucose 3-reductase